ncbi:MAG: hypothetical protein CVU65_13980 [Deltaproteobacteria bacterium HGW-Deltaproteobacteria-22]|jgi:hypothetical protein|nr:MAG: hypothetical protein CVU65_13980 [Deltaproteobacteria bacterium HGW-Deltaproteobacteria-22]
MKILSLFILILLPSVAAAQNPPVGSPFKVELEGGVLFQTRNEVQIPNEATATRIDLVDQVGVGPLPAGRLTLHWNFHGRHGAAVVLAPLEFTRSAVIEEPVRFDRVDFAASEKTDFTFKFNSWRLNYNYRFLERNKLHAWVGFTAKIRDAKVAVEQDGRKGELTNLGFVPLLFLALDWEFADRFHVLVDFNGLAGGPGRAFDVSAKIAYDLTDDLGISLGYRTIEGGADVASVYNFAWLHYGVISVWYRF